ncbi:MAG: glutathione S-transferase family protein [Gammaproteobacteria bacterium]|nr:glutathione S-transferase family protein [Gammaproteobacteria bacterium]
MTTPTIPLRVYGSVISYYTGKIEGYLRYKEIPYVFIAMGPRERRRIVKKTGAAQMPAIELPDGRFMTDTTPMIAWLETQYPEPAVIPVDPLQAFFSRLIEDYAEEWLWRPAMHYRWSYRKDRLHVSRKIADEVMAGVPLPGFLKRELIRQRQHRFYVKRDGVSRRTWDHVESIYLKSLDQLEAIFAVRPYLLGEQPTLADFGFFAPMFRHFAQDPTVGDIMRAAHPAFSNGRHDCGTHVATRCPVHCCPVSRPIGRRFCAKWAMLICRS